MFHSAFKFSRNPDPSYKNVNSFIGNVQNSRTKLTERKQKQIGRQEKQEQGIPTKLLFKKFNKMIYCWIVEKSVNALQFALPSFANIVFATCRCAWTSLINLQSNCKCIFFNVALATYYFILSELKGTVAEILFNNIGLLRDRKSRIYTAFTFSIV